VSSRLAVVDTALQLEFELGLTLLSVTRPSAATASRDRDVGRHVGRALQGSRAARIFLDLHRFETTQRVGRQHRRDPRLGARLDQMLVGDLASEAILARACRMLLSADEFVRVDLILEMARWRARSLGDMAGEDDALRLVVLSKLWQGSLDEAEEACRRHDELGTQSPCATWWARQTS